MITAQGALAKTPTEERRFDFDFRPSSSEGLETGEVIQASPAPTVTATPSDGILLIDQVTLSGDKVQARFRAGVNGTTYHVTCTVTTILSAQSQVRQLCGDLLVQAC